MLDGGPAVRGIDGPAFYSYTAPEPPGLGAQKVRPESAFCHPELKEFVLMYDEVRRASNPEEALLDFVESTYEAGASQAEWPRSELEVRSSAA